MATPPSLMHLCQRILSHLLISDLDYWDQYQALPQDVINGILLCLPPLTLHELSNEGPPLSRHRTERQSTSNTDGPLRSGRAMWEDNALRCEEAGSRMDSGSYKGTTSYSRKRDYNGSLRGIDFSALELGMSAAWKSLYSKRWPWSFKQMILAASATSDFDDLGVHGDVDWQQLYWEAHLQDCLNAAAGQPSVSVSDCRIGDTLLPRDLVNNLRCKNSEIDENPLSTLGGNCSHFGRYARKLRLQSILCSSELVTLLKQAQLQSITIFNVRIRSDLTGLCQLLTVNMATLQRLEFYHSKFSGETLNKIGRVLCSPGTEQRLQHFALISSRIFDQADLFSDQQPYFLHFLSATRHLRSLKLWDNSLEQENAVYIVRIISKFAKNLSSLQLVDNELGEVFTTLLSSSLASCKLDQPETMLLFSRLRVLDLRSNMLDAEAVGSLVNCLMKMPSLQRLNMSDNPLEDAGIRGLIPYLGGSSTAAPSLEELSLATCRMTATGATLLLDALSSSQSTIRRLSLANNLLGSTVVQSLAKVLLKCTLETLDISDIDLGPTGCSGELEEALISNRTLLHIDISKNRISMPGAAMLASIISSGCSSLTTINASANLLSMESITSIATALQTSAFRQLAGTRMTLDLRENPGSFLCKLAGVYDRIGALAVLLSDSSREAHSVLHDDDP